jgi:hypothetical protein
MIKIQLNIKKAMIKSKVIRIRMHAISTVVILTVKYAIKRKISEAGTTCILHTGMHIRTTVRDKA